jgi:hypothetical protein
VRSPASRLRLDVDAFLRVLHSLDGKSLARLEVSCKAFAARAYILPAASAPAAAAAGGGGGAWRGLRSLRAAPWLARVVAVHAVGYAEAWDDDDEWWRS